VGVALVALRFNHDPTAAVEDAMSIRRNAITPVPLPEWQEHRTIQPEDSPAAYALRDTFGHDLTIKGRFRVTHPPGGACVLQAIPPRDADDRDNPDWPRGPRDHGNVLGHIPPTTVTLPLHHVRLWEVGVGVHDIGWNWYYHFSPDTFWTYFGTSKHRIYTVLALPTAPWRQSANLSDSQLPWTEVLDYACTWAYGCRTFDDVAAEVTAAVYNLGPSLVEYDCPGGGSTHYAYPSFNCTAFLERLRGGIGNGRYVNCSDCATILSTFANVLGCDYWQSRMGYGFGLNPLLAIGSSVWQTACGWPGFSYHEVAWHGACTANDVISDACLQVNGGSNPVAPPYVPLLPVNLLFGVAGAGHYRDRLASPAGAAHCNPQPATRQRRVIF
jgi:hypothetical protein